MGVMAITLAIAGVIRADDIPVSPLIRDAMAAGKTADFLVVLRDNPAATVLAEARAVPRGKARRRFMVKELQRRTFQSQNNLGYWLLKQGADYKHFWIVNQVLVKNGTPELLKKILTRKDVAHIDANPRVELAAPQESAPLAATAVEWNISLINADQVWSTFGVNGAGVVVAVNDTGVMWTHEALKNQYRGWNGDTADHTYSWHDAIHFSSSSPCGGSAPEPCDDLGHGTHVAGIIAGQTLANQIGVAPGAKWIACRSMDNGFGTPTTYLECLEWFLAPGGDADQAPHIINNSWGCPPTEGCNQSIFEEAVNTVRAAGIMVVAANGNYGPTCATTFYPPAIYRTVFSVGATDSADNLYPRSSRGPVTYNGETYIKPDITAPGVSIRSSYYDGAYFVWTGTSMAAPHVAGAAALLWSAFPRLRGQVETTEAFLKSAARPMPYTACGDVGVPNNGYGYGIVDVLSAYRKGLAAPVSLNFLLLLD